MSGRIESRGIIGFSDNMKPTLIWQTKVRNGKETKVPFITFRMWDVDYTLAKVEGADGVKRRVNKPVQVILPEDQRGLDIFANLAAGRHVLVRGRLTHRPNSVFDKEKADKALAKFKKEENTDVFLTEMKEAIVSYPNPVIYMDTLDFMDDQPLHVAERVMNVLQSECNIINDEQANHYFEAFKTYFHGLKSTREERIVKDKTKKQEDTAYPLNTTTEPTDPDDLGLQ